MKRNVMLWIVIGVLFVVALFMVFKAGSVSAVSESTKAASDAATSGYSGMVGSC